MIWAVYDVISLGLNNIIIGTYFSTKPTEFWGLVPAEFLSAAIVKASATTKNSLKTRENSKKWVIQKNAGLFTHSVTFASKSFLGLQIYKSHAILLWTNVLCPADQSTQPPPTKQRFCSLDGTVKTMNCNVNELKPDELMDLLGVEFWEKRKHLVRKICWAQFWALSQTVLKSWSVVLCK